ncbi:MAG: hypothetical protein R3223_06095 [Longimicrobiales bacterium]|nr:hypothetical protein [Longimicrobiales bacterium]
MRGAAPVCALLFAGAVVGCTDGSDSITDPGGDPGDDPRALQILDLSATPGRTTSDLWVHGNHAYTGTWSRAGSATEHGNALFVWDVSDPADPILTDSVIVDARVVNDVKVSPDGTLAVLTHEGSSDGLNGITLLDLQEPGHPEVITRYTQNIEGGVHNTWLENDYVYVVGHHEEGLRIVDITNPGTPVEVAHYYAGESFVHDVYVEDGLAFVSHWNAGLAILDVGNGVAGGSPVMPVEVSRTLLPGDQVHNAWYWSDAGYAFVGEEDFIAPGIMRVLDVSDPAQPVVVATYGVPGDTPHNFWLDEGNQILYLAWYTRGVRALDVSGELSGDLAEEGREVAVGTYGPGDGWCASGVGPTCTWAPQVHDGHLFLSDIRHGLVTAELAP